MHLLQLASALSSVSLAAAWTTYVVPHSPGSDDTPALTAAFSSNPSLATSATILFQQGVTYNISTPIKFPKLTNVIVSVQGNITYATDVKKTQAIVKGSSYPGYWFTFTGGSNVTLEGSQDNNWGWVNSNGQKWWDTLTTTSSQVNRPHGWGFHSITNGEIKYMKLWQPVAWSFSTQGTNLHIHDNTIMAVSTSSNVASNTDGFDAQGTNLLFENNVVYNSDDCLAIGSPVNNLVFRDSYCNGGHGLSVGSLGKGGAVADVKNILIENVVLENCSYGARFKSWVGGNGIASNVTWKDITLKNVRRPIYVTQNYWDSHAGSKPTSTSGQNSTHIDTFTFQNFQGTINDANGDSPTGATGKEIVILDLYAGTASNILAKNLSTTTVSGSHVMVWCDPTTISTDVGFKCWDGLYQPTAIGE